MYKQEIKDIEERIQNIAEQVNAMLSGIAGQSFTNEERNQIIDKMNILLKFRGKVTEENLLEVSIASSYFQELNKTIMGRRPSMEDSLCELYVAILHNSEKLRLIFDYLSDDQKIDLKETIKELGGIDLESAVVTKAQVVDYLKRKGG